MVPVNPAVGLEVLERAVRSHRGVWGNAQPETYFLCILNSKIASVEGVFDDFYAVHSGSS